MAESKISCWNIKGKRIDFISENFNSSFELNKFIHDDDAYSGETLNITLLESSIHVDFAGRSTNGNVVYDNSEQISMYSEFYGAPLLISFYKNINRVVFSLHSTWPGAPVANGLRVQTMHGDCRIDSN